MRAMAGLAFALYALNSALLLWLHWRARHVDPIAHAVSDFGIGDSGALFRFHAVIGCAAALALAVLVAISEQPPFPGRIAGYLSIMAVARLGVGFFPTDGVDVASTRTGRAHTAAAVVVFVCAALVVIDATSILAGAAPTYAHLWTGMKWLVVATLAGMAATRFERWRRGFGLFERAFIVVSTLWFMAMALSFL